PFQIFPTADGWIVVVAAKEKFFVRLCEALERPELANDERFRGFDARRRNRTELVAILEPLFAVQATAPMVARLRAVGVPCGPVNSVAEALAEPQTAAREMIVAYEHPEFGTVRSVASPVRVGASAATHRRAPRRGEDRDAILRDLLNYSPERVATAAAAGAFGVAVTAHAGGAEGIEQ
ncbi:MAG: CoA transferase, partial [Vulcanimicrobiaceae bacterium]